MVADWLKEGIGSDEIGDKSRIVISLSGGVGGEGVHRMCCRG